MPPADPVYLDWAASAPLCAASAQAMAPFLAPGTANLAFGANANSLHSAGRAAFAALEAARESLAAALRARRPDELVFTSGATEANNAALLGIALACRQRALQQGKKGFGGHIVVLAIEHDSVLEPAARLKALGFEVSLLRPDRSGFLSLEAFQAALRPDTVLASVQTANNEIGSLQDIPALAAAAHAAGALFHTDAVQALGKVPVDLAGSGVDAASFSAHKVGGPKGVGALYLKATTPFDALLVGGGQEAGKRSGTSNVCGALGFTAAAVAAVACQEAEAARLTALRDRIYAGLAETGRAVATVPVEAGSTRFAPHIANVCVAGMESETLIIRLDQAGFAVSGGSACSSRSLEPSHVLRSIGVADRLAQGALRVSIGALTTAEDIEAFIEAFQECVRRH